MYSQLSLGCCPLAQLWPNAEFVESQTSSGNQVVNVVNGSRLNTLWRTCNLAVNR